jgi:hypothetical protein
MGGSIGACQIACRHPALGPPHLGSLVSPSAVRSRAGHASQDACAHCSAAAGAPDALVPERHFIFVGDTGYGTSETARFCRKHGRRLTLVSKFYGDAAFMSRRHRARAVR